MQRSKSSPAESSSLGVTSQLCHSNASRPNSVIGRGGIRNPIPRCVELVNQHLRLLRHSIHTFFVFKYHSMLNWACLVYWNQLNTLNCTLSPCWSIDINWAKKSIWKEKNMQTYVFLEYYIIYNIHVMTVKTITLSPATVKKWKAEEFSSVTSLRATQV